MFQKSFFAMFAFIHNEEEDTYRWVLRAVRAIYDQGGMEYPRTLITDRDSALSAAIKKVKPKNAIVRDGELTLHIRNSPIPFTCSAAGIITRT